MVPTKLSRRERAAIKIQSLTRGALARAVFSPILTHHKYMVRHVINIQCRIRVRRTAEMLSACFLILFPIASSIFKRDHPPPSDAEEFYPAS